MELEQKVEEMEKGEESGSMEEKVGREGGSPLSSRTSYA